MGFGQNNSWTRFQAATRSQRVASAKRTLQTSKNGPAKPKSHSTKENRNEAPDHQRGTPRKPAREVQCADRRCLTLKCQAIVKTPGRDRGRRRDHRNVDYHEAPRQNGRKPPIRRIAPRHGPDARAVGLLEWDLFDAVPTPSDLIALISWCDHAVAERAAPVYVCPRR